jgi:hypothetical protein
LKIHGARLYHFHLMALHYVVVQFCQVHALSLWSIADTSARTRRWRLVIE